MAKTVIPDFDDLLKIIKGGAEMTLGQGPTRMENITCPADWEVKAGALRDLFRLLLGRIPDSYRHPLSVRTESEEDCGSYRKRTISYLTGPKERIRAYLLIPVGISGRRPAVVTIHPTNHTGREQVVGNDPSPEGQDMAYGLHLAERGYVTFSYDLLSANERKYPGYPSFTTEPFYRKYPEWSVRGKDIWDLSRAVDVLETIPEVDPGRIGALGHSQGGGITIDAMVLEPRLKTGVSNCGDFPAVIFKNPFNRARTGWWVGTPNLRPFCWCGKNYPVDLHEKLALIAPRPFLQIVALNDWDYVPEEKELVRSTLRNLTRQVKRVYRLCGSEDNFQTRVHSRGHSFKSGEREFAYRFLDNILQP